MVLLGTKLSEITGQENCCLKLVLVLRVYGSPPHPEPQAGKEGGSLGTRLHQRPRSYPPVSGLPLWLPDDLKLLIVCKGE